MKGMAVVFSDQKKVEFREVDIPEPGPNDVVVRTRYSWISNGTEGSLFRGERINGETPYRAGDPWPFPIVPGYQSTGLVERVGKNVSDLEPGQWVFASMGYVNGMYEKLGGHISPKIWERSQVWPLPDGVSPVAASGLILTQVGYNCGIRPHVEINDLAVVIGDGMVGHWSAQTLHWRGARVLLAGKHDDRLALFGEGNRRYVCNISCEDMLARTRALSSGGINVLVDTVGSVDTINAALPLMAREGHIVSAGFHGEHSMIDLQKLRFGEQTLHSPSGWQNKRVSETLALLASGHLETEKLITHRFPVERVAAAWQLITQRDEPVLGVILEWE